jgi:hypothetical protein
MNKSLLAVLNDAERLLVGQTERAALAALDEDAAIELEARVRRARNKYVGQYRRAAAAAVAGHGGRGKARPENTRAAMKAEAFEEALSRVSGRVAALARQSAAELRAERLAAARAAKQGQAPGTQEAASAAGRRGPAVTGEPTGDPFAAVARPGEAPGQHPRHGWPPAGQAGQPQYSSPGGLRIRAQTRRRPSAGARAAWGRGSRHSQRPR